MISANDSPYENAEIECDDNFDEYAAEDNNKNENACMIDDENESANTTYLKNIKDTIKEKISERKKGLKNDWIVKYLQENNWLMSKRDASKMCCKLGAQCNTEEYHRDCYVWLPDVRWGEEAIPFCPNCQSNERVGPHGFQNNHHARHIFGKKESHCIISRRHICYECENNTTPSRMN